MTVGRQKSNWQPAFVAFQFVLLVLIGVISTVRPAGSAELASSEVDPFEILAYEIVEDLDNNTQGIGPHDRPRVAIWPFKPDSTPVPPALANEYNAKLLSELLSKGRDRYRFVAQEGLKAVISAADESNNSEQQLDNLLTTLARETQAEVLIVGSLRRATEDQLVLSYKAIAVADGTLLAATSRVRIRLDANELRSAETAEPIDLAIKSAARSLASQVPEMRELRLKGGDRRSLGRYLQLRFAAALQAEYRNLVTGGGLVIRETSAADVTRGAAGQYELSHRHWNRGDAIEVSVELSDINGIAGSWHGRVAKDSIPLEVLRPPFVAQMLGSKPQAGSRSAPKSQPQRKKTVTGPSKRTVRSVQRDLTALGYSPGAIDGLLGPRTRDAIGDYQYDKGFKVTGLITDGLLKSLQRAMAGLPIDRLDRAVPPKDYGNVDSASPRRQASYSAGATGLSLIGHNVSSRTHAYQSHCREYQKVVTIGNRPQVSYGTACRKPDGGWRLQRE